MEQTPIVWIVNDSLKFDYKLAEAFGRLNRLTMGNVNIFDPTRVIWDVRDRMEDFNEKDYLLLSGPALLCIVAVNEALRRVQVLKLLVWGAKENNYEIVEIQRKFWEFIREASNAR